MFLLGGFFFFPLLYFFFSLGLSLRFFFFFFLHAILMGGHIFVYYRIYVSGIFWYHWMHLNAAD